MSRELSKCTSRACARLFFLLPENTSRRKIERNRIANVVRPVEYDRKIRDKTNREQRRHGGSFESAVVGNDDKGPRIYTRVRECGRMGHPKRFSVRVSMKN